MPTMSERQRNFLERNTHLEPVSRLDDSETLLIIDRELLSTYVLTSECHVMFPYTWWKLNSAKQPVQLLG